MQRECSNQIKSNILDFTPENYIIISESGVFAISQGKELSETHTGEWGSVVWFTDDAQLGVSPLTSQWWGNHAMEKSNLGFGRARMKATAQSLCSILKSSPVPHLTSVESVATVSHCCVWYSDCLLEAMG